MAETTESGLVIEDGVLKNGLNCIGDINVPKGVKEIADKAFYNNKGLTGLSLPDGLLSIGKFAVSGCVNLNYVQVPDSVTRLGEGGLVKRFESNIGFTHVMENKEFFPEIRCSENSWIAQTILAMKKNDGWNASHSMEHVVELHYI